MTRHLTRRDVRYGYADWLVLDAGVVRGLAVIGEVLQRKEPFTILWDVRSCSLPSRQQLHIGTEWARTHKPELDKYVPV